MSKGKRTEKTKGNSANPGFVEKPWAAADKLRGHMDAAEYKHVVLGSIFLKYIFDAFEVKPDELAAQKAEGADPEYPDEYRATNISWMPKEAHWARLIASAPQPTIGKLVDDAIAPSSATTPGLRGHSPRDYLEVRR